MKHKDTEANLLTSGAESVITPYRKVLLAIACGLAVANIYYAHPLLDSIANDFHIHPSTIGMVITVTQVFYAVGLIFLVPLGDLINPRRLILSQMVLMCATLVVIGFSSSEIIFFFGIAVVGVLATITQTIVAYASTLSSPSERGSIVGFVTSGIVIGILLARTISGIIADLGGWRAVYFTSAVLMFLIAILLSQKLPNTTYKQSPLPYPKLLRSVLLLFAEEKILLIRGILALFIFAAFSTLWTSLVMPLSAPPHSLSHTIIGAFGIAGVAGAIAAAKAGQLADRGLGQRTTGIALLLLVSSWVFIDLLNYSLFALVIGIILLDLAIQAVHVTNQSFILALRPEARSRLTAAYMTFYSIGSALGSISSTTMYDKFGWDGVCLLGASFSIIALLFWMITRKSTE
ncbi:MFS transporter [Shimazuella soli]|uniref:MFS transporter n=1 Tax=Shimazuella soli TaxID=1892854 RepID=UPI003B83293E